MLRIKKLIAYFGIWTLGCIRLCACSGVEDEVIWIGSEAESMAEKESTQSGTDYGTPVSDRGLFKKNSREIVGCSGEISQLLNTTETNEAIRVYVCGAVVLPGVVEIPADSRVEAALEAAGGFAENANRTYVNLAAWVADGQMLYFPTQGECMETPGGIWSPVQTQTMAEQDAGGTGLVNINAADAEMLCTLPGIGESRAADIIAYREANGFFGTCEDIMRVPGIKEGLFEKICDKITVE